MWRRRVTPLVAEVSLSLSQWRLRAFAHSGGGNNAVRLGFPFGTSRGGLEDERSTHHEMGPKACGSAAECLLPGVAVASQRAPPTPDLTHNDTAESWSFVSPRTSLRQLLKTTNAARVRECLIGLMKLCRGLHLDIAKQEAQVRDLASIAQTFADERHGAVEQQRWHQFTEDLNRTTAAMYNPGGAIEADILDHIDRLSGHAVARSVLAGKSELADVELFLRALLSEISNGADRITDNQRVIWRLCQVIHDPRVDRGSGAPGTLGARFLPPRTVQLNRWRVVPVEAVMRGHLRHEGL